MHLVIENVKCESGTSVIIYSYIWLHKIRFGHTAGRRLKKKTELTSGKFRSPKVLLIYCIFIRLNYAEIENIITVGGMENRVA